MTDTPLRPCPFCNGADIEPDFWVTGDKRQGPGCSGCNATANSVDEWNHRPYEDMQEEVIEEYESLIRDLKGRAKTMKNARRLVGPEAYHNDPEAMKIWCKTLYQEGKGLWKTIRTSEAKVEAIREKGDG